MLDRVVGMGGEQRDVGKAGAEVVACVVIVDRGARAAVEAAGLPYLAAFELSDLGLD